MSMNCIRCCRAKRTGLDLLCDLCRRFGTAEDRRARHAAQARGTLLKILGQTQTPPIASNTADEIMLDVVTPFIRYAAYCADSVRPGDAAILTFEEFFIREGSGS